VAVCCADVRGRQGTRSHRPDGRFALADNEFIVDGDAATRQLPESVEAFFYARSSDKEVDEAAYHRVREQHARFLRTYRLQESDVPLVRLRLFDWREPFSQG
jgi:hypothetical protein